MADKVEEKTDKLAEKIALANVGFQTHVDEVAAAIKKLIDAGCQNAVAAETALKVWMQHHFGQ